MLVFDQVHDRTTMWSVDMILMDSKTSQKCITFRFIYVGHKSKKNKCRGKNLFYKRFHYFDFWGQVSIKYNCLKSDQLFADDSAT